MLFSIEMNISDGTCVKDAAGGDEGAGAYPPQRGGTDTPKQPDPRAVNSAGKQGTGGTPRGTPRQ